MLPSCREKRSSSAASSSRCASAAIAVTCSRVRMVGMANATMPKKPSWRMADGVAHHGQEAMTPIRTPAVAGSWYPGTASALDESGRRSSGRDPSRSGRRSGRARGAARRTDVLGAGGGARLSAARGPHVRRRGARRSVPFRRLRRRVDRVIWWLRDASGRVADRRGLRAIASRDLARSFASIRPRMPANTRSRCSCRSFSGSRPRCRLCRW